MLRVLAIVVVSILGAAGLGYWLGPKLTDAPPEEKK